MSKRDELARLDGVAQAKLVARGEVSAGELLESCAERIEALDPLLNAICTLDLERARSAAPPAAGPFSGVPFLVKDIIPYPGLRWSLGSRLMKSVVAPQATAYSQRLDEAGLVVIGKSTTSELGLLGSTETLLEGVTHNPWGLTLSAAGSSGGSAAAVAAGIVPFAHASDGGGSIRVPASVCGLFGLKPSRGRTVPAAFGESDFGALVSEHCVSRSVRDSALLLSLTEARGNGLREVGYVQRPLEKPLRIGAWTRTLIGDEAAPAVRRAWEEAVALCRSLGHEVEEISAPDIDGHALADAFFIVAGEGVAGVVQMMAGARGTPVARDELEPLTWALVEEFQRRGAEAMPTARRAFAEAAERYLQAVAPYDVVLTPTLRTLPWQLGHLSPLLPRDELIRRTADAVGYTPIHNIAGCPAMSVPLHWTEEEIPVGIHFAAAVGEEATLLGLAYQLEEARPWRDKWPPYSWPMLREG